MSVEETNQDKSVVALAEEPEESPAQLQKPIEKRSIAGKVFDVGVGVVGFGASVVTAPIRVAVGAAGDAIKTQTDLLFKNTFPQLVDETILDTFNCAWSEEGKSVLRQGILYATKKWLCFAATVLSASLSVEWEEVKDFKKQKSFGVFDNVIVVVTHLDENYVFTSFLQRDTAFSSLYKIWAGSSS
jgi:hypothetical protein